MDDSDMTERETSVTTRAMRRMSPLTLGLAGAALLLFICIAAFAGWLWTRPGLDELQAGRQAEPGFEDINGNPLVMARGVTSEFVPLEAMPASLPDAVVALEDRRFRDHGGVDYRAMARAMTANLFAGGIVEGGSTITQQLVKISYLTPERTYIRKIHEALLAWQMERRMTKDEILETYLNTVYLGSGARGVGAAAAVYFDKPAPELTLAESAVLASTIRTPSGMNAFSEPDALRDRAALVIDLMRAQGRIEEPEANAAKVQIATMTFRRARPSYGGWFADWAEKEAAPVVARLDVPVTLRTTLDPGLQKMAEAAVGLALNGTPMQAALVALRPDGTIAAMVGGRDYSESQFNRATDAIRQPGSTFKTFVYLTALSDGMTPESILSDRPVDINGYQPQNFGGNFHGDVNMATAFAQSMNAASVNLAQQVGIDRVAETARALGVSAELSETPSLALGASGMSLLDLTEAYAAIATGNAPIRGTALAGLLTGDGTMHEMRRGAPAPQGRAAQLLAHRGQMAQLLRTVVTNGTGQAVAGVPGAVGKTGTSQNFRDALFVGWADPLIVGVWVGNDDNSPMDEVTGGGLPARIWADFMRSAAASAGASAPAPGDVMASSDGNASSAPAPADQDVDRVQDAAVAPASATGSGPTDALLGLLDKAADGRLTASDLREVLQQRTASADSGRTCNVEACSSFYRSFRASDCTYQPYGNRPRQICDR